ncbi:MAG: class I SAM-dependent methyltransferase [Actinobacteria bacterium]|nr:class I SAM-dependent methyltransferase [Actinomycetota bacterium]
MNNSNYWETLYKNQDVKTMPWYLEELDPDLEQELKQRDITKGTFLDLCTGPGIQAVKLRNLGFTVIGTDIAASAIYKARMLSGTIEFMQDDILNSKLNNKQFDYIFDRGCFHTFLAAKRKNYLKEIVKKINKDGLLFLKCFTGKKQSQGPYRISKKEIENTFNKDFYIEKIKDTFFLKNKEPFSQALFVVMRKR